MLMPCFFNDQLRTVMVEKIDWNNLNPGDTVFIAGNLKNGQPTRIYGPHTVVDIENKQLQNSKGAKFFERFDYLFIKK